LDRANLAKHGVSLADAEQLDWNELTAMVDDSQDCGEERSIGYAPLAEGPLHMIVFVEIEAGERVCSLEDERTIAPSHRVAAQEGDDWQCQGSIFPSH
jgi:uncharacterized DUF497 family protein